jgi:ABC-type nitrate/sulfonate/bicarbonate transport system permease component
VTSARRGNPVLLGSAGLAGLLLLLELLPRLGLVDERFLPPTSRIMAALADEVSTVVFWRALGDTLYAWAVGLILAVTAGVLAGLAIGSVPVLRALTASTVEFLRPIPSVALIPLAVLLYGTELGSTLLLVCYASFWQVLVQVLYGVADVDPVTEETARSFRFSAWGRVQYVLWPTALPYVFTGFRLAASVALVLAITAELVIGAPGLGKEIATAQASDAVATMYALIVVTGALGVIINLLTRAGERHLLTWHQSVRGEVAL